MLCLLSTQKNNKICFPFSRASPNLLPYSRASPMKVIKIPASGPHSAFQQQISSENASNMPPGVKVVKLSAASTMVTNQRVAYTSQVTIRFYFNKQSGAPNSKPVTRKSFFLILLVISNLLWQFSTHSLLFFLHAPLSMKVCGKLFFLTEKCIACEENYFSSRLALVHIFFPKWLRE